MLVRVRAAGPHIVLATQVDPVNSVMSQLRDHFLICLIIWRTSLITEGDILSNTLFHCLQLSASLNSSDCFLLQTNAKLYAWSGNLSTAESQKAVLRVAEVLKVGVGC
jgi:hypothetical protein